MSIVCRCRTDDDSSDGRGNEMSGSACCPVHDWSCARHAMHSADFIDELSSH